MLALLLIIGTLWVGYALAGGLGVLLAIVILVLVNK